MRTVNQALCAADLLRRAKSAFSRGLTGVRASVLMGAILGLMSTAHAVDIKVAFSAASPDGLQKAIDQCPDNDPSGCRVILTSKLYPIPNSLFLRNKSNITIMSSSTAFRPEIVFQDNGSVAGPDNMADSLALKPAGWKRWPMDGAATVGGATNTSNPFSTSGIQRNGTILIQGCHNITIDGIKINGKTAIGWGSTGVWESRYPTFYGNFGINLYLSGKVTVRNCEIVNCFSGFYIMNRNLGGALAHKNAGDLDAAKLAPGSRYGEMGGHIVEQCLIHNNTWGVFEESNYDLGTTWRFNRMWDLHNNSDTLNNWVVKKVSPCFDRSNWNKAWADAKSCDNSESVNHAGGFMFMKDVMAVPDKVYHNTFWKVTELFGASGWRGGTQHYFYNNLVLEPWLDYNADTTNYRSGTFTKIITADNLNITAKMGQFMYDNTFAYFPKIPITDKPSVTGCTGQKDSCLAVAAALREQVWPKNRITIQAQDVQGMSFPVAGQNTYLQPLKKLQYIDAVQYQGQGRKFLLQNNWKLEELTTVGIPKTNYISTVEAGNNGKAYTPALLEPFAYTGMDSNAIAARFGRLRGLPDADTIGLMVSMGDITDSRSHQNHYIKSVPMNFTATSAAFLTPVWTDRGVDSSVLNRLWSPDGAVTPAGVKALARGAMQPDGSNSVPMMTIVDDQPASIVGKVATVSFDLNTNTSGLTNIKWVKASFIPEVKDDDQASYKTAPLQIDIASLSAKPVIGGNTVLMTLPDDAGAYSRIELMVSAVTPDGRTIYSNVGLWLIRKSNYSFNVKFFTEKFGKVKQDTVIAGKPVWMRVEPSIMTASTSATKCGPKLDSNCYVTTVTTTRYTLPINQFSIKASSMWDASPDLVTSKPIPASGVYGGDGKFVPVTGVQDSAAQNVWWIPVYFTKSGLAAPVMTGLANGDTGKVFQGGQSIFVRPGAPYRAELRDPSSYRLSEDVGTTVPYNTPYKAWVDVKDKYGNMVDVTSKVTLSITPVGVFGLQAKVGDDLSTATMSATITVPDSGSIYTRLLTRDTPAGDDTKHFVLNSYIGTTAPGDPETVPDSAYVKVGKVQLQLSWVKPGTLLAVDSVSGFIKDTVRVTLQVTDGDGKLLTGDQLITLSSNNKKLRFALPTKLDSALSEVTISTGSIDLIVTSDYEDLSDVILARPSNGDEAEASITPVNFRLPPVPPYPALDSARFVDTDCDAKADVMKVWLRAAGAGGSADLDTTKTRIHAIRLVTSGDTVVLDSTKWSFAAGSTSILQIPVGSSVLKDLYSPSGKVAIQYTMLRMPKQPDTLVWAGDDEKGVSVLDRVAPRLDGAAFLENYTSANDTFYVHFTEPVVSASTGAWPFTTIGVDGTNHTTSDIIVKSFEISEKPILGTNTYRVVVEGNRDATKAIKYIQYTDSLSIDALKGLTDASGNAGVECAQKVGIQKLIVLPAFGGKIFSSNDSLGRANALRLTFVRKLKAEEDLDSVAVDFGYSSTGNKLAGTFAATKGSDDSSYIVTLSAPFAEGLTRGKSELNYGAQVTVWSSKKAVSSGIVGDSVPAVLVNISGNGRANAQLTFGDVNDTLLIKTSEPMTLGGLTDGLVNIGKGNVSTIKLFTDPTGDSTVWNVVQSNATPNVVMAGDIISMGASFVGKDGVLLTTGNFASKAVVIGGDRGPIAAYYTDTNGVGTASEITIVFGRKLTHEAKFRLNWISKDGTPVSTEVVSKEAIGETVLHFDLKGLFPVGATGNSIADGTLSAGVMTSILSGPDSVFATDAFPPKQRFSIQDSVQPYIVAANVTHGTYTSQETAFDTLWLKFSEPVNLSAGEGFAKSIAKQVYGAADVALDPFTLVIFGTNRDSGYAVFDTSATHGAPGAGDSIRVTSNGSLWDNTSTHANSKGKYVAVDAGARPPIAPKVDIVLPNPTGAAPTKPQYTYTLNPKDASPLVKTGNSMVIVQSAPNGVKAISTGSVPGVINTMGDLDGTIGIKIASSISSIGKHSVLSVLLYDSYGTFVGKTTADLDSATLSNGPKDGTGGFTLMALWDGRAANGQLVNSGVYTMRVLLFKDVTLPDGSAQSKLTFNLLRKIGISR